MIICQWLTAHKDHRAKGKSCWLNRRSLKKRKDAIPLTHFCHANTRGKIVLAPFYNNWIRFVCHNTLTIRPIQLITTLEHFRQVLNGLGHLCTLEKLNEAVERFSTTSLFLGTANHVTLREGNETVTPMHMATGRSKNEQSNFYSKWETFSPLTAHFLRP